MANEEGQQPKTFLEPSETSLIEDAAQTLTEKVLIRLLRRTGARVSEVLGIEERHINFTKAEIKIEHQKIKFSAACPFCKGRLNKKSVFCQHCGNSVGDVVSQAKTVRHLRAIPIDKDTVILLRQYIKAGGITVVDGKRMLFSFKRSWAYKIVVKCANRAGFRMLENPENERHHHVSPHKFRDSLATHAIQAMPTLDDARLLQELLGHQNIGTTLRYRKVQGVELHGFYDKLIEGEKK